MIFDIVFGLMIFLFALKGATVGLVRQAFVLIRVVIALIIAIILAPHCALIIRQFVHTENLRWWTAFLLVFFGIWFFIFCIGLTFSSFLKSVDVTFLDRLLGFLIGTLCGFIVCVVITMFLISQPFIDIKSFIKDSDILQAFEFYIGELRSEGLIGFQR